MRRLLVLGFSNTALDRSGYVAPLRDALAAADPELEAVVFGFGGLTPHFVPIAFDHMNATRGPFSHVVLEIATSAYARSGQDGPEAADDIVLDCLDRVVAAGARPALVHLYRDDLRDAALPFAHLLSARADALGYPVVDLAEGLVRARGLDFARSLLRDEVHTTPEGSRYQGEAVAAALAAWLRSTAPPALPPPPARRRRGLALAPFAARRGLFEWQDGRLETAVVAAGETLTATSRTPLAVFGLTYLCGPRTGRLEARWGRTTLPIDAHDRFSHFRRIGMRLIAPHGPLRRLDVRQDPVPLDVALRRGTPDPSPREGELLHLLHYA